MKRSTRTIALCAAVLAVSPGAAPATRDRGGEEDRARHAYVAWRTHLRHDHGVQACRRMTHKLQHAIVQFAESTGGSGQSCEQTISLAGHQLYAALRKGLGRIRTVRVNGNSAILTTAGGRVRVRLADDLWRVDEHLR